MPYRLARALGRACDRLLHPLRRARARARLRRGAVPVSVLVVCHGNICRSPYAAAVLRLAFARRWDRAVRIVSAGFLGPGRSCPPEAVAVAGARGVDLGAHRSALLTPSLVRDADRIAVMDARQRRALWERFGRSPRDVFLLGDLDPAPIATRAIADPIDGSVEVFERSYARIDRCVDALVGALAGPGGRPDPRGPRERRIAHHFTVDVEEYFQVTAFERRIPRSAWDTLDSRIAASTRRLLELLDRHEARATFFVLGWVARRHPELVHAIADAGHEVASHGWSHRRVTTQGRAEFRASVRRTKALLEDLTGQAVGGYRAPSFSIVPGREWALDVLIEEGYRYDSSLFPIRRPGYGYPGAHRGLHWIHRPEGRLAELPPATLRRWGLTLPAGGGAYFRLLPYRLAASALSDAERRGEPATFYIHPWELDAVQPRLPASWPARVRHYGGLARTVARLERLLREFRFTCIADTLEAHEFSDGERAHAGGRDIDDHRAARRPGP